MDNEKKIKWSTLAFMCFSTLWGFGNVLNGFVYFNGVQVIFSWLLMFGLYFIPYALMVGEMGSAFKHLGGGVTSWIQETTSPIIAYYAGWTYWAVHIPYIASKGSGGLKALSWMIFQNAEKYASFPTHYIQLATLAIFLVFCYIASKGINPLKKMASIAGSSMFVMGILYIIMMYAAPAINPKASFVKIDWSMSNLIPTFNLKYLSNLAVLVFAVGGIEKISPYVNKMEGNPSKEFPKSIIFATVMVIVSAIFGTIAMGMMFDVEAVNANFDAYVANGSYWAFQRLGEYYGMGNFFLIIYAACNAIGQFAVLLLSIDAPLRMLLEDPNSSQFIPKALLKKNKNGAYVNGIWMVVVLSGTIILAQALVPGADTVLKQLIKLNAVMMPLRYLWVFFAYISLKKLVGKFPREYHFTKSSGLGKAVGLWCFLVTLSCCILGIYSDDKFQLMLNIITPLILIALGFLLPMIRKSQDAKEAATK